MPLRMKAQTTIKLTKRCPETPGRRGEVWWPGEAGAGQRRSFSNSRRVALISSSCFCRSCFSSFVFARAMASIKEVAAAGPEKNIKSGSY